ncbi:PucR family transcriptional regulator [Tepidibacillus fermentans]|uniref:PucR-like helix-turn-helix protein n=1 Tax=Tepidibacillus fermentans TaxID=1281767 RepID=A0A4R3KEP9_9BACI|nr:helix-turn-helix domain-containing protein [Tepidibacillus fermentans]TCS81814.1 PucR-like helix-turn-helix protein [Tepidibacillus fermentans]
MKKGMELIRVKKGMEKEQQRDTNTILLLETEEERIYLKVVDQKQTLTIEELQQIVSNIRDFLANTKSIEEKLKDWLTEILTNEKAIERIQIPNWVREAKGWHNGWFPVLFLKKEQGWEEKSFIDIIQSYIPGTLLPIPISQRSLLVLVSNEKLRLDQKDEVDEFAFGLYEMLQNEWHEEVKIGIHKPATSIEKLLKHSVQLIQDMSWIKWFYVDVKVFSPWNHFFERMIAKIPSEELKSFIPKQWMLTLDPEIEETIRVFLEENLNMSETARRLFIHRNTLQYRIDKVKQQTGLDVKQFHDAMTFKWLSLLKKRFGQIE